MKEVKYIFEIKKSKL